MRILVLGAAAGGGFPQWNANNAQCRRARADDPAAPPQTQSSLAVSADGRHWFLLNASPDLRQQINDNRQLHPQPDVDSQLRHSPINGVILTNADVDHIAGLLTLREREAFNLYATARVQATLKANSVFNVLNPDFVSRHEITLNEAFEPMRTDGLKAGFDVEAFPVPGKVALFLENPDEANFGTTDEDTIGLRVRDHATGRCFFYIPGCAALPPELAARLDGADLVFFDGTLFTDDEMLRTGEGVKTGQRMGHMSMTGDGGTIDAFAPLDIGRRIFIHINNTNPVLMRDSAERRTVEEAGWEIAEDGMEIEL